MTAWTDLLPAGRPAVMGVVNVTPDSFSDGGRFHDAGAAHDHALALLDAGADMLDIGGESTRPGAEPVGEIDELDRVMPVIEAVRAARRDAVISIDTMKPDVAGAAVGAGAAIWNAVDALRGEGALDCAADLGCAVCLMHMQGEPRTMQADPRYDDVVAEVEAFLMERAAAAETAGIARDKIALDPGIGFGKTLAHNLALLAATDRLAAHDYPLLVGASRKRFIAAIDETATSADDRLGGSLAAALWAARAGASIIRVHDVRETVQALKVQAAIGAA
ncbi:dihydropteroate synthase [Marinicauda salina]|uniref:Dihydropteroate synthase n=1 Tax=Marinicauda salina TaxID=2135793 RepID=A0A2U2BR49_9PROT|nr:dihydropteroate synthase [Marinicauda salina]PWE16458.1 dihydropteroate synthase [Marinicauda salina]